MLADSKTKPVVAPHTAEGKRLAEAYGDPLLWRKWGPYVSERSWGTVREDYSAGRPGIFCTTWPAARRIAGARTAWRRSATAISSSSSRSRSGTGEIRS